MGTTLLKDHELPLIFIHYLCDITKSQNILKISMYLEKLIQVISESLKYLGEIFFKL